MALANCHSSQLDIKVSTLRLSMAFQQPRHVGRGRVVCWVDEKNYFDFATKVLINIAQLEEHESHRHVICRTDQLSLSTERKALTVAKQSALSTVDEQFSNYA